jgi:hypothetical protein
VCLVRYFVIFDHNRPQVGSATREIEIWLDVEEPDASNLCGPSTITVSMFSDSRRVAHGGNTSFKNEAEDDVRIAS